MIINHDDLINNDLIEKILYAINNIREDEMVIVYLSSKGGENSRYNIVLDIVNNYSDKFVFIFNGICFSNAFRLAMNLKCKKSYLGNISVMCHQSYFDSTVHLDGKVILPNVLKPEYKKEYNTLLREVSKHLTKDQLKDYKLGEDVYIPVSQFKKIIK